MSFPWILKLLNAFTLESLRLLLACKVWTANSCQPLLSATSIFNFFPLYLFKLSLVLKAGLREMLSKWPTFNCCRIFVLSYTAIISFLSFLVCLFVLPTNTAGTKTATLNVISGAFFFTSNVSFFALVGPKLRCCRCAAHGVQYVGLEVIWMVVLLPVVVVNTLLSVRIRDSKDVSNSLVSPYSIQEQTALDATTAYTLSNIIVTVSSSIALLLSTYAALLTGLAVYSHMRSHSADIWFSNVVADVPPFVFPPFLRWLRGDYPGDDGASEPDYDTEQWGQLGMIPRRRSPHSTFARNHQRCSTLQATGFHLPGCACTEKLASVPTRPDEFRALQREYRATWTETTLGTATWKNALTSRYSWSRGDRKGGHRRAVSAPAPMVRIPTERERRRSLYYIGFDAV
ncbi:hypothetical protein EW145_g4498 [Phellinidium pouzarii]|uniref:Uncharacterized protein n=1 Tax=Phellinidium pouzarii TaxID=167371 RepID=A0A4V3XCH8_9AGAM|nr:hypothetical protein EW145_g4498 [Phellinidium pouzarii]